MLNNLPTKLADWLMPVSHLTQAMCAALTHRHTAALFHDSAFPDRLEFRINGEKVCRNLSDSFGVVTDGLTLVISPRGARLHSPWLGEIPLNWREKRALAERVGHWVGDGEGLNGPLVEV